MNPTNDNNVPPMELPSVSPEMQGNGPEQPNSVEMTEIASSQALEQGVSQSAPVDPSSTTNLGPQPAVAASGFDMTSAVPIQPVQQASMPAIADDNDLIEKEWVDKAKQIVEHTRSDPHEQNKEVTKMKVDYLKKRYNKDIKVTDD
ncbi:hypothetical protein KDA00_00690 [Candidatus Saccharibacteria bacterium]|nr:hypothetical protein [Candidatus Saccharibacteria bacterium]